MDTWLHPLAQLMCFLTYHPVRFMLLRNQQFVESSKHVNSLAKPSLLSSFLHFFRLTGGVCIYCICILRSAGLHCKFSRLNFLSTFSLPSRDTNNPNEVNLT